MTREAKIGLLVALAFVLVIGILLSDHVTTSTREPGAPLAAVEQSIRGSITAPGANTPPVLPPRQEPDPTIQPVTGAPSGTPFVFNPAGTGEGQIQIQMHTPPPTPQASSDQLAAADGVDTSPDWENNNPPANTATFTAPPNDVAGVDEATGRQTISTLAREAGEDLVPVGQQPGSTAPGKTATTDYTVQKGDSLSRITAKFLGRDTPTNRDLLLSLNPDLRKNPDMIRVGAVYKVPTDTQAAATLRSTTPVAAPAPTPPPAPAAEPKPAATGRTYTVKSGDSLWAIAESQLGSGARMNEILKLNKDQVSDADAIAEGMTLKLPA